MSTSGEVGNGMSFVFYVVEIARRIFIPLLLFVQGVSHATSRLKQFLAEPPFIPIQSTINPGFRVSTPLMSWP